MLNLPSWGGPCYGTWFGILMVVGLAAIGTAAYLWLGYHLFTTPPEPFDPFE